MNRKVVARRGCLAGLLMLAAIPVCLWLSTYEIEGPPVKGEWPIAAEFPIRDAGFDAIAKETHIDPRRDGGLRFMFDWPRHKWLAIAKPVNGKALVAIIDTNPSQNTSDLETYSLSAPDYARFISDFDRLASSYAIVSSGFDGISFNQERCENRQCTHAGGNASFSARDERIADLVNALQQKIGARRHGPY